MSAVRVESSKVLPVAVALAASEAVAVAAAEGITPDVDAAGKPLI